MSAAVHDAAIVDPTARLSAGVVVGPHAVVGANVELAEGVHVGPHCVVEGPTAVGPGTVLSSHVVLGSAPQDLKYGGELTALRVGARNRFREFVTVNRGTEDGGGLTAIGDDNLFMTGSHVAHDCRVGNGTIFANNATLAGHVDVADCATIGAFSAVHQFCHVGPHAFVGGFTVCTQDVLPYMKTVGGRGGVRCYGVNRVGLERRGLEAAAIRALHAAFRRLRAERTAGTETIAALRQEHAEVAEVQVLLDFVTRAREARGYHG